MPELPEVEVVRRGVARWFTGRTVAQVDVLHPRAIRRHEPGAADFADRLVGQHLTASQRRGKYMWLTLADHHAVVVHLGMSGQILVKSRDEPLSSHLRIRLRFDDDGDDFWFVDQRTFGGLYIDELLDQQPGDRPGQPLGGPAGQPPGQPLGEPAAMVGVPSSLSHIASDPLDPLFNVSAVVRRIRAKSSPIKAVLLDQTVVSGIGNIYADEALWRTKLHWQTPANLVPVKRLTELLNNAEAVMREALDAGGTSFDSLYVNVNGSSGYFSRSLDAYGREDQPCRRCGTPIVRERFANRSSFRCPQCQRRPRHGVAGQG